MGAGGKVAAIVVSMVVLVAVVAAVAIAVIGRGGTSTTSAASNEEKPHVSTSTKAIESICQPTDYKKTCVDSLSAAAGHNTSDPKELIQLAFKVAMDKIHVAMNHSQTLQDAQEDPMTKKALETCGELFEYAVDDLKNSFDHLGAFDISKIDEALEDLKIWLSGTMTHLETCEDGFENTTSDAGESLKKAMKTSKELASNALAMVDQIASILGDLEIPFLSRRLLSEEDEDEVSWITAGRRRLMAATVDQLKPNVVVAQDGSGKFKTINAALKTVPKKGLKPYVIHVKEGTYLETVEIGKSMTNVVLIGDGPTKTRISGSKNFIDGTPTFKTCTLAVIGEGFIGKDFAVENTAGPAKHQAVALRVQSDMSIFHNCQFDGYQDTLYVHSHRQFYRDCLISGTIDFIFGNSATVFQNCVMMVRRPLNNQQNIVTAQGRKDRREPTALILHNCTISADRDLEGFTTKNPTYLGRPWKEYSRTFFLQCQIDSLVHPDGWLPWTGDFGLKTCFYTEFDCRGAGAATTKRVKWKGIKKMDAAHAQKFTAARFIQGARWIPKTGVPFTPGLLPVGRTK